LGKSDGPYARNMKMEDTTLGWRFSNAKLSALYHPYSDRNSELAAIYYGDGMDMKSCGVEIQQADITRAREVADAFKEVMQAFRQAQNSSGLDARVEPVWRSAAP